jgi:LmbE family N-acetylglucosaminyl deacetylase
VAPLQRKTRRQSSIMKALQFATAGDRLSVLCLGAHADDIEIGVGATLLSMIARGVHLEVHWCVLSGVGDREREAQASAADFLSRAGSAKIEIMAFKDGFFPEQGEDIKSWFETLKARANPDVILTHYRDDAHQDHRQVCRLTWNTFRDHCILEYEIPKWDGDMGQPNLYVPVSAGALRRKIDLLNSHFGSQRSKQWFDSETFLGLARLRGMECRAPENYAEAFFARKLAVA